MAITSLQAQNKGKDLENLLHSRSESGKDKINRDVTFFLLGVSCAKEDNYRQHEFRQLKGTRKGFIEEISSNYVRRGQQHQRNNKNHSQAGHSSVDPSHSPSYTLELGHENLFDSYIRSSENLSLTFYTLVIGGLVFGVVHPRAISFFTGPNIKSISETGLHLCSKQAKV